jgi:peptide/nickel transport system permease protein
LTTTAHAGQLTTVAVAPRRVAAGLWSDAWWRLRRDWLTMGAAAVLLFLLLLSFSAPLFAEHVFKFRFEQQNLAGAYTRPTLEPIEYLLGGDELGRSQVVRLLYAGQISLLVGFSAALVALTIGVAIGLTAGYLRGRVDDLITWFITTLNSIPGLYLLLIISGLWSPGPLTLVVVIGALFWTSTALFVRGQTFSLREREFVTAARTIGASGRRIMLRHILPNILPLIIVLTAIDVGAIILLESALSFLGVGIMPPTPSWGNMLTNSAAYFVRNPWLVVSPGAMIFLTVLSLYLIGDGLRDALDPRLRGSI